MPARGPYAVIGITRGASERDIRTAYRTRALRYHSDLSRGPDSAAFIEMQQAQVLVAPGTRDGRRATLSLGHLGVAQAELKVTVRIEESAGP